MKKAKPKFDFASLGKPAMPKEMQPKKFGGKMPGGKLKRGQKKMKTMFPPGRVAKGRGY